MMTRPLDSDNTDSSKTDPWQGDWRARVHQRVRALGFDSVTAFAASMPTAPYRQLAAALGEGIAPVQLEKTLRAESIAAHRFNLFARDCLARYLRQDLPEGWARGVQAEFNTARAFASWNAALSGGADEVYAHEKNAASIRHVWQELGRLAAPGWLPQDANDPLVQQAFRDLTFAP